jgi:methanogenic corrinoid protein MtbC1
MAETAPTAAHSIQTVSRRTGLTPDVIRAWERRYGAVEPSRSATRRRLYTDADVQRLLMLRRATLAGRRIGEVARLPLDELTRLVEEDETAEANAPQAPGPTGRESGNVHLTACLDAVKALDHEALESALRFAARELGTDALLEEVLVPLMHGVGDGWKNGSLQIYHEHMATTLIRSLLDALRSAQLRSFGGPEIVVATPAGENHELGAMMAALIAAAEGWRVSYLGPDLPGSELAAAVELKQAKVVALSVVHPREPEKVHAELRRLREALPSNVTILVGGRGAADYVGPTADAGFQLITDLRQLGHTLAALKRPA